MVIPNQFAPNLYTDDNRDPTAYGIAGVFMFVCIWGLFIDWPSKWNMNRLGKTTEGATKSGWLSLLPLCGLLAIQIATWVQYRELISEYYTWGFFTNGYIYPRDIFALSMSILTFIYVAINGVLLPTGYWMSKATPEKPNMPYEVKLGMFYMNYIFWTTFYAITCAFTYKQFQVKKADVPAGTYAANMDTLSSLILSMGLVMIVALYLHYLYAFAKVEEDGGEVKATKYHGIVPMSTVSQKLNKTFIIATSFYSSAVLALIYSDYYQFATAGLFLNGVAVMFTVLSKDSGTYSFYFALALWVLTTVSYTVVCAVELITVTGVITDWSVPAANAGLMLLQPSKLVTTVSFAPTLNLVTGLAFAGCVSYLGSVFSSRVKSG